MLGRPYTAMPYRPSPRSIKMSHRNALQARQQLMDLHAALSSEEASRLADCCLWELGAVKTQLGYLAAEWDRVFDLGDPMKLTSWTQIINAFDLYGRWPELQERVLQRLDKMVEAAEDNYYDVDFSQGQLADLAEAYEYDNGEGSFEAAAPLIQQLLQVPKWFAAYDQLIDDLRAELEWNQHKSQNYQRGGDEDPHPPGVEDLELVWHATTAYPQIIEEGFKLRSELEGQGGLGGSMSTSDWQKEGISFTGNEEVARSILESFWDMAELLQGPRDKATLLSFAKQLEVPDETIRTYIAPLHRMSDDDVLTPAATFDIVRHIIGQASVIGTYYDPVYMTEEGTIETFVNLNQSDAGVVEAIINTKHPDVKYLRSMDEWRVPLDAIVSYGPVGSQQPKLERAAQTIQFRGHQYTAASTEPPQKELFDALAQQQRGRAEEAMVVYEDHDDWATD